MTSTTVIVMPPQQRNCIIQEGKTYCEDKDMTKNEFGGACIILLIAIIWFGVWFKLGEVFDSVWFMAASLIIPLIIGSLLLFI